MYVREISCLYQVDEINHVTLSFHKKDDLMYGTKKLHPSLDVQVAYEFDVSSLWFG